VNNKKIVIVNNKNHLYNQVKKNIEETWPDWKIKYVNDYLMISKHSNKLKLHKETEEN
jgi:hypothetical protein